MKKSMKSLLSFVLVLSLVFGGTLALIPAAADDGLAETVLYESDKAGSKTVKTDKTDAYFKQIAAIKDDVDANGAIDPDAGEYYELTVTASVDQGEAELYIAENNSWEEYHGTASGVFTTTESTVVTQIRQPLFGIEGQLYAADHGDYGHTITWSYVKCSVFRKAGATTASTTASPQKPAGTTRIETLYYGDANTDGTVNMKDVLVLRKYLANLDVTFSQEAADATQDGEVNMKDVLAIRKFVAGLADLPDPKITVVTDPVVDPSGDYDYVPDQITLTFYGASSVDHAVTWHTYKESKNPVVQFVACAKDATPDFANATSVSAKTTAYKSRSMPYDPVANTFTYGNFEDNLPDYSHQAVMSGLAFDTAYAYRVGDPDLGVWSDVGRFTTRPETVDAFSFVYTSDTQVSTSKETTQYLYLQNTLTGAFKDDPDVAFIVNGGDVVQYGQYLHQWRNVLNGNKQFLMNNVMMPVTGNHDAAYSEYLSYEITKHFCVEYPQDVNTVLNYGFFYSYDYGDAHFVVLNTDSMKSSDGLIDDVQLDWLKKDLAGTDKTWKIVQLHRPLISVRASVQSPSFEQLIGVFNDGGVDLVMQAHEHVFLRSHPIDGEGTILKDSETVTEDGVSYYKNPQGVLFMTSATGGKDGKAPSGTEVDADYCYAYGTGKASSWSRVTIDGNKLTVHQNYYAATKVNTYEDGVWGIIKDAA